ncbi:hypothetical protein L3i22_087240 [Actinoplanes sp. L3-i22]|nr:hypothetical protein L3i22_087240 [Actinoplanes sp. L3-i22]
MDSLPKGLTYARDGGIDGIPEGHITIRATETMSFSKFTKLIKGVPWEAIQLP